MVRKTVIRRIAPGVAATDTMPMILSRSPDAAKALALPAAPGYDRVMSHPTETEAAKFKKWEFRAFVSAHVALLVWMAVDRNGSAEIAIGAWGAIIGLDGIANFVHWLNRRDDPRHAKRPPDPP
jgi:hypothetical protein